MAGSANVLEELNKNMNGRGKGKYEIKPPRNKIEERDEEQHITVFRPNTII